MKLQIGNKLKFHLDNDPYAAHYCFSHRLLNMDEVPAGAKLNYIEVEIIDEKLKFSYLQDSRKSDTPFTTSLRQTAKPVTVLKKLLPDCDLSQLNSWIDTLKLYLAAPEHTIVTTRGDDILYMYHENNYVPSGESTLGNSCMRYDKCQPYLEFYARNRNVSGVYVSVDGQVAARALIWTATHERKHITVLDRIYAKNDVFGGILDSWSNDNCDYTLNHTKKFFRNNKDNTRHYLDMYVALNHIDGPYPYLDNFSMLMGSRLYNILHPKQQHKILTSTTGTCGKTRECLGYAPGQVWVNDLGWRNKEDSVVYKTAYALKDWIIKCGLCNLAIMESSACRVQTPDNTTIYICNDHVNPYIMYNNELHRLCSPHRLLRPLTEEECQICATTPRPCSSCTRLTSNYITVNARRVCADCQQPTPCGACNIPHPFYLLVQLSTSNGYVHYCADCVANCPICTYCDRRIVSDITTCPCEEDLVNCRACDRRIYSDDAFYIRGQGDYCGSCYDELTFCCNSCGDEDLHENVSVVDSICRRCYETYGFTCTECNTATCDSSPYADMCASCAGNLEYRCSGCRTYTVVRTETAGVCETCLTVDTHPF